MNAIDVIVLLVIAGIAGAIAQAIVGYSSRGCLASIVLGFIGALFGMFISRKMGLGEPFPISVGGKTFPLVWSIVGAALFVGLLSLISRPRS